MSDNFSPVSLFIRAGTKYVSSVCVYIIYIFVVYVPCMYIRITRNFLTQTLNSIYVLKMKSPDWAFKPKTQSWFTITTLTFLIIIYYIEEN